MRYLVRSKESGEIVKGVWLDCDGSFLERGFFGECYSKRRNDLSADIALDVVDSYGFKLHDGDFVFLEHGSCGRSYAQVIWDKDFGVCLKQGGNIIPFKQNIDKMTFVGCHKAGLKKCKELLGE